MTLAGYYICLIFYVLGYRRKNSRTFDFRALLKTREQILSVPPIKILIIYATAWLPVLLILISINFNIFGNTRAELKEIDGISLLSGVYLFYLTLPVLFIAGIYSTKNIKLLMLYLTSTLIIAVLIFIALRIRTTFLAPMISFGLGYLWSKVVSRRTAESRSRRSRPRLGFRAKEALIICVITIGLISTVAYGRFYRGVIEHSDLSLTAIDTDAIVEQTLNGGDLGYGTIVDEVIRYVDEHKIRLYGQSYWRVLLVPIPRALISDKPENTQRIVASWLRPDIENMTLPPGIQGDAYLNFGYLGILVFSFVGYILGKVERSNSPGYYYFTAASFVALFHLCRGGFTNPLMILITIAIGSAIYLKIINKNNKSRNLNI